MDSNPITSAGESIRAFIADSVAVREAACRSQLAYGLFLLDSHQRLLRAGILPDEPWRWRLPQATLGRLAGESAAAPLGRKALLRRIGRSAAAQRSDYGSGRGSSGG